MSTGGIRLRTEWVEIAGHRVVVRRPADPDALLDAAVRDSRAEADEEAVYWTHLWEASIYTAAFLFGRSPVKRTDCLEIGCGLGLVGTAAALAGYRVTFSDRVIQAARLAVRNAAENGICDSEAVELDWRQPPPRRWPVIVASDILYEPAAHGVLADFLNRCLEADGIAWIGDPGRHSARDFVAVAKTSGLAVTIRDNTGTRLSGFRPMNPQIFELRRSPDD